MDLSTPQNDTQQQRSLLNNTKTQAQVTASSSDAGEQAGGSQSSATSHIQPPVEKPHEQVCERCRQLFLRGTFSNEFTRSLHSGEGRNYVSYESPNSFWKFPNQACPLCWTLREQSKRLPLHGPTAHAKEAITYEFSRTEGNITFEHRSGRKTVTFDLATNPGE